MYSINTPAEFTLPELAPLELASVGQMNAAMRPALIIGGVTLGAFVLSMVGVTAIHRVKDRSWYCSLLPSVFWSSLVSAAAGGVTFGALAATGKLGG